MADNQPEDRSEQGPDLSDPVVLPRRESYPPPPEIQFKRPELPGSRKSTPPALGAPNPPQEGTAKLGAGLASGVTFAASIIAGFVIGQWVDKRFNHTDFPWGMLVFTLLGAAAGFINLYRLISATDRNQKK